MTFADYRDALEASEIEAAVPAEKPMDPGGDCLPFDHLEDRRFEVLAYRLTCADLDDRTYRVRLMQATGDKGRDILVYTEAGQLATVLQCKKYRDRISAPQLVRELLKFAFHVKLAPSILSSSVSYELWCPGGLSEPAAHLFDTWPNDWTEEALAPEAAKVLHKYAAFDELTWDETKEFATKSFPQLLRPRSVDGLAITRQVRKHLEIHSDFFEAKLVMQKQDVETALEDVVRRVSAEQARYLNDGDARHVLDRITSFEPKERLVSNCALVMGLKPELVSRLRRAEYERFAKHMIDGLYGLIQVVMNACARIQGDIVREFRERTPGTSRSLPAVIGQILTFSMLARLNSLMMPSLKLQPGLVAFDGLPLDQRFKTEVERLWDSYQKCLSAYDAARHAPGSDAECRWRIATLALEGVAGRSDFDTQLFADFEKHGTEIERVFSEWMALVPKQILLVADTTSIFESEWLFKRMQETVERLTKIRGSAIIPE